QLDLGAAVVLQLAVAALDALDLVADIGPLAVGGGEAVAVNHRRRADIDAEDVGRGIATNDTVVEALLDLEVRNGKRPLAVTLRFEPALLLGVSLRRPGDELQFVGNRAIDTDADGHGVLVGDGDVAALGFEEDQLRLRWRGGAGKRQERPAQMLEELATAQGEDQDQQEQDETGHQSAGPASAASADSLLEVGPGEVLRRLLAEGALHGGRQRLVVQIKPVDDAVLRAGQRLLDLAGGEVGIDVVH